MCLDTLPDLVLHQVLLRCAAKDIDSLRKTNARLFYYITNYRLHFKKSKVRIMSVQKSDNGQPIVEVASSRGSRMKLGRLSNNIWVNSIIPEWFSSYDHDELVQMSPLWWKDLKNISLLDVIDYRRYLPFLNGCHRIDITTNASVNLTTMLEVIQNKSLIWLRVSGSGEVVCNDADLREIAKVSNVMNWFTLKTMSETSHITSEAILEMLEMGSFDKHTLIYIARIADFEDFIFYLKKRTWLKRYRKTGDHGVIIYKKDGNRFDIGTSPTPRS